MQRSEVLQQKLERWCAASIRALSDNRTVRYRGRVLSVNDRPFVVNAPHLQLDFSTQQSGNLRGIADAIALRLMHSDGQLHQQLSPSDTLAKLCFDLLEQLRCEALAPDTLVGMRPNLNRRFLFWAQSAATSELVENDIGLLLFSLLVMSWSRLMAQPIPTQVEDVIEQTRWGLASSIGAPLRELKQQLADQHNYSKAALEIATVISAMVKQDELTREHDAIDQALNAFATGHALNSQFLLADVDALSAQNAASVSTVSTSNARANYRVFTDAYDREQPITDLIRAAQLDKLRKQLDQHLARQAVNIHRVARYIQQLLRGSAFAGWSFAEEQGYLDAARLARLISSPNDHRLFRQQQLKPKSATVVSLLIDNSGSMTHHNPQLAMLVDSLAKALDMAQVETEVLGFTTREWNGGRVYQEWQKAGQPANPGRLNALSHTVYKSSEQPLRRARRAIAGLMRTDLFRESIDGEALQWAFQRLRKRPEKNKIILMVSDGSPMDTCTLAANQAHILDQHLLEVTQHIENSQDVKLCAVGVGLDLSCFYRRSLAIDLERALSTADYCEIVDLLCAAL